MAPKCISERQVNTLLQGWNVGYQRCRYAIERRRGRVSKTKICHADFHTVEICGEIAVVAPNEGSPDILLKRRSAKDQI